MKKIRVVLGGEERDVPLESSLVVGRDPRCEIHDSDPELSRRHAEFVVDARGIIVRDLNSRNGIRVNGVRCAEAVLRSGDLVQAAKLQMRYLDDVLDDPTEDAEDASDDRTVAVARAGGRRSEPATASTEPPPPRRVPAGDDETSLLSRAPRRDGAIDAPHTAPIAAPSANPVAAPSPSAQPTSRRARASWGARVLLQTLALALVVFLLAWIPMSILQGRAANEAAVARGRALGQWLAADAAGTLARGASPRDIGARVTTEPGVVAYLVMSPSGEVLAPASRARAQVSKLPGLGAAPSEISRVRAQWNGDLLEVALPVAVGDDPRAAIAWLQLRPATSGGDGLLLVPLLLLALLLGWLTAIGVRRRTLSALARFNEDIDLVLAGQGPLVQDPMGTPPTRTLADVINHLAARVRAGESSAGVARRSMDPEPRRAPPGGPPTERDAKPVSRDAAPAGRLPVAGSPARECRIVASPTFRVTEASAGCADLLGVRPESLVGQHVLDTIPDRAILDAILKCLSKLAPVGEERVTVTPEARPFRLGIVVSRAGRNEPIEIAFSVDGERA